MTIDWWPTSLAHIPKEDPWAHDHVIVAEIKSFDDGGHMGTRFTISALVPIADLDAVCQNLAALDPKVSTSGPWPFPREDRAYEPRFWIDFFGLSGGRYEPLVLPWLSHDHTVFVPEPGFLMTYGLVPRPLGNGAVHWDNPAGPVQDIVKVTAPSVYSFPKVTPASVSISRDYVQDYLTLRKRALVQSFAERRFSSTDREIEERLGSEQCVDLDTLSRRLRLFRIPDRERIIFIGVSGARVLARPGPLPISNDPLEAEGLIWPGFDGPVVWARAMGMKLSDCVYVDDRVLADFEGRSDFIVYPESGAVRFGTQWTVGYCCRAGRNLIRLELKKLYEDVPAAETRRWNKFAVEPPPPGAYPAILDEPNIGKRSKALTYAIVSLGENLEALTQAAGLRGLASDSFVGLRRSDLDYKGWWSFPDAEAIGRHVPLNMPVDAFLDRCLSINKLVVDGLVERSLRKTLHAMGVPPKEIKKLRTLKPLDCVVRMCQVARASGLGFANSSAEIWQRLSKNGTDPPRPIPRLFALYDMRILKAHRWEDQKKLAACLERFSIDMSEAATGYGAILDRIYDALIAEFASVNELIQAARGGGGIGP
jgi:hypothetical protein